MSEAPPSRRWTSLPLHPFLVACLPVIWIHRTNLQSLYVDTLLRPLLVYLVAAGVLLAITSMVTGGLRRGAPAATAWCLLLLYGGALGTVGSIALTVGALGLTVAGRRWGRPWPAVGALLNVAALFLVLFNLYQSWDQARRVLSPEIREGYLETAELGAWIDAASDPSSLPDIYYVVLDGMARLDVLEELYDVDTRGLRRRLWGLGFEIAEGSYANYPQTALSVASALNLESLEGFLRFPHPRSRDRRPVGETVSHSRVARVLAAHGYRQVAYPSGYPFTRMTGADEQRSVWPAPDLAELYLLNETLLTPLQRGLAAGPSELSYTLRRRQVEFVFADLPELAAQESSAPRFVFAHVLAPHPPFVFGRYGEAITSRAAFSYRDGDHWDEIHTEDDYRELYRGQALYTLEMLLECMEQILERSTRPALIIVQGDHGPGSELEWASPSRLALQERLAILNVFRASEGLELPVYPSITPVNSFRVVFNALFSTDVPAVEDRVYYSSIGRPFVLRDLGVIETTPSEGSTEGQ